MTPEQQRAALAEWAGWEAEQPDWDVGRGFPPDYLNDLNAVHELEMKLPKENLGLYATNLSRVVGYAGINNSGEWLPHNAYIWHATAAQRCEALLKTLNPWKP